MVAAGGLIQIHESWSEADMLRGFYTRRDRWPEPTLRCAMLRRPFRSFVLPLVLWCVWTAHSPGDDPAATFFENQVKPVLVERCLKCHGSDRKGGLDLRPRNRPCKAARAEP